MTKWQEVRLGDVCDVKGGKRLPKGVNLVTIKNTHPYIRVRDLGQGKRLQLNQNYEYVDDETQKIISHYIVSEDDVLISIVGTIGLIGIVGNSLNNANLTENCVKLINLRGIDKDFLYYFLISNSGQDAIKQGTVGAVQAKLPIKNIQTIQILLPPLDVQKKIAGVLGALDDKIELNNRINNNLEQQAQTLFKSWFVDFEPFGGKMPDDWKVGNLLDIADYLNGLAMQKFRPAENDKGLPVLKIKELRQGFCDSNSELCSLNVKNEYIVNDGDVIFSWSGSLLVDFWCGGKCGLNQHLFKVTSKNFDKWFYFLWTKHYLEHFAFIAADKATTMGHIKREELEKAKVIIPSSECYQKMKQIMTPIYNLLISNRVENTRLSALRDALLPKLMSGEIDVSNVDISALTSTDKLSFTGV